ncbi:hypothetical protein PIB30_114201, partial [Stylosanthes scabra]|nr:hypothetical protein [Stylosanthes scabra]
GYYCELGVLLLTFGYSLRLEICWFDSSGKMNKDHGIKQAESGLGEKPTHDSGNAGNKMGNSGPQMPTGEAKVSFRDKLIGDSTIKTLAFADTLCGEKVAKIDSNTEDDIPAVSFTED